MESYLWDLLVKNLKKREIMILVKNWWKDWWGDHQEKLWSLEYLDEGQVVLNIIDKCFKEPSRRILLP